jgi:hypothetical protein
MPKLVSWFGVRVVVEILVGKDPPAKRTYEDRVIVVRAQSDALARRKAERIARADGETYRNIYGENVTWRFKDVVDTYMLLDDKLSDGTEIYSAFMNYRFYQSLANRGETGVWTAYLKAHPRADPSRLTVGRVLEWNAQRSPKSVKRVLRLSPKLGVRSTEVRRRPVLRGRPERHKT